MVSLIISIILFFAGLIVFTIGYVGKRELVKEGYIEESSLQRVTLQKEELCLKVDEADKLLQELNKFSTYISKELETKHRELLFLYQLIDEKQETFKKAEKEVIKEVEKEAPKKERKTTKKEKVVPEVEEKSVLEEVIEEDKHIEGETIHYTTINEELTIKNILKSNISTQEKIQELFNIGKSIEEIARILKRGKSEIRLMIDMSKKE